MKNWLRSIAKRWLLRNFMDKPAGDLTEAESLLILNLMENEQMVGALNKVVSEQVVRTGAMMRAAVEAQDWHQASRAQGYISGMEDSMRSFAFHAQLLKEKRAKATRANRMARAS